MMRGLETSQMPPEPEMPRFEDSSTVMAPQALPSIQRQQMLEQGPSLGGMGQGPSLSAPDGRSLGPLPQGSSMPWQGSFGGMSGMMGRQTPTPQRPEPQQPSWVSSDDQGPSEQPGAQPKGDSRNTPLGMLDFILGRVNPEEEEKGFWGKTKDFFFGDPNEDRQQEVLEAQILNNAFGQLYGPRSTHQLGTLGAQQADAEGRARQIAQRQALEAFRDPEMREFMKWQTGLMPQVAAAQITGDAGIREAEIGAETDLETERMRSDVERYKSQMARAASGDTAAAMRLQALSTAGTAQDRLAFDRAKQEFDQEYRARELGQDFELGQMGLARDLIGSLGNIDRRSSALWDEMGDEDRLFYPQALRGLMENIRTGGR